MGNANTQIFDYILRATEGTNVRVDRGLSATLSTGTSLGQWYRSAQM